MKNNNPAGIEFVGRSDEGKNINNKIGSALSESPFVPQHPEYGAAKAESRRRVKAGKARGSNPLNRKQR